MSAVPAKADIRQRAKMIVAPPGGIQKKWGGRNAERRGNRNNSWISNKNAPPMINWRLNGPCRTTSEDYQTHLNGSASTYIGAASLGKAGAFASSQGGRIH